MYLNVITTYKCNLHCKHCIYQCPGKQELKIDVFEKLIEKLIPYGLSSVTFTGGEPIMHSRFNELCQFVAARNLKFKIISNAHLYKKYLPIIQTNRSQFIGFNFSLDGLKKTHDYIRQKGSFEKVIEAIYFYNRIDVKITIQLTLNKRNLNELEDFIKMCADMGVAKFKIGAIVPTSSNHKLQISIGERKRIYYELPKLEKKHRVNIHPTNSLYNPVNINFCPVVNGATLTLNQEGNILYCCNLPSFIISNPSESVKQIITKKISISREIIEDRVQKNAKSNLEDIDHTCYYCINKLK